MTKYIELEALKNRFAKRLVWLKRDIHDEYSLGLHDGCESDAELIDEIPAADVAPVVHAKWIVRSDKGIISMTHPYMCSRCWRVEMDKEPYCNCGAKMDLEDGEDNNANKKID